MERRNTNWKRKEGGNRGGSKLQTHSEIENEQEDFTKTCPDYISAQKQKKKCKTHFE